MVSWTADLFLSELAASLVTLPLLLPFLAVGACRLHDTGRSGRRHLFWLLPVVGWILLVVWWCQDGDATLRDHRAPRRYLSV